MQKKKNGMTWHSQVYIIPDTNHRHNSNHQTETNIIQKTLVPKSRKWVIPIVRVKLGKLYVVPPHNAA